MTFEELQKKRNYEIKDSFTEGVKHHTFTSCNLNTAREALAVMKDSGLKVKDDVCGSPSVGGYYADGFTK